MSSQEEFDRRCDRILSDFEIMEKETQKFKEECEELQKSIDDAFRALGKSEEEIEEIHKRAKNKSRIDSFKQVK